MTELGYTELGWAAGGERLPGVRCIVCARSHALDA